MGGGVQKKHPMFFYRGPVEENYSFPRFQEVQHFPGGGPTFPVGVQMLIPIETYMTCDFPRGASPSSRSPDRSMTS